MNRFLQTASFIRIKVASTAGLITSRENSSNEVLVVLSAL
jgi:hypothetical protein